MKLCRRITRILTHCHRCLRDHNSHRTYSDKGAGEGAGGQGAAPWRVLSGLQPSGDLHLGNYFGCVRRCVRLQDAGHHVTVFVADLHALTAPQEGGVLRSRVLDAAALLLAAGLDPERSVLFAQSAVPRHAELCWLLACLATQARLRHLPQYRERAAGREDAAVPLGVLLYPVLQAADVLLHGATHVPVGRDQLRHLQLAAQLARTARHRLGVELPAPKPLPADDGGDRVLDLRDPSRKMSKSDPDPRSRVLLVDGDDAIRLKIRKAVTDLEPRVTYAPETRPGVSNLVLLHCLAAELTPERAVRAAEGLDTARYKAVVAEALVAHVAPIRERAAELRARPELLRAVLAAGAARARKRADEVWARVAAAAGLR